MADQTELVTQPAPVAPGLVSPVGQNWALLLRLSALGFLVNCQPSEPYLYAYLTEDKNLTDTQLNNQVWPYDTYGAFLFLIPVGVLAELCGYWPVIVAGLLCRQATRLILLFGEGVQLMAMMQLTYAMATCANAVYFSYALKAVSPDLYVAASACPLAAYHLGNVIGSLLAELLHNGCGLPLQSLFYVSWAFTTAGCLASLALPPLPVAAAAAAPASVRERAGCGKSLFRAARQVYGGAVMQLWACYWLFGFGASYLVGNYYQNVLYGIDPDGEFGYAEALNEVAMSLAALAPALRPPAVLLGRWAWLAVLPLAAFAGAMALLTLQMNTLGGAYALTALMMGTTSFLQSIGTGAIAHALTETETPLRFAAVIATNQFAGLGLATIMSQILAAKSATTADYYRVGAAGFFCAAAAPAVSAAFQACRQSSRNHNSIGPLMAPMADCLTT